MATLEILKPFDNADPDFLAQIRHPEILHPEVKFFTLLGTGAIIVHTLGKPQTFSTDKILGILLDDKSDVKERMDRDILRGICYLAHKAGLPQPTKDNIFYEKLSELDVEKVMWGVRLFAAIINDEIANQVAVLDRRLVAEDARRDAAFRGRYDHRIAHAENPDETCTKEMDLALYEARRAGFDHKMMSLVRDRLWNMYWSRGRAVPDLQRAVSMVWDEVLKEHSNENESIGAQERRYIEDKLHDDLTHQLLSMMKEHGLDKKKIL